MSAAFQPMLKWLGLQLVMVLGISALFLFRSPLSAGSALIGGLIFLLPHGYFTLRVFAKSGRNASAGDNLSALMTGEAIKLVFTAFLFAAVFATVEPLHVPALLFTFAVMVVSQWLAPLAMKSSLR